MANRYVYSKRAARDLKKIYIDTAREWGVAQADKYAAGLENVLTLLAENPNLGRRCDEIRAGYRRFEHARHIIFYRGRKADIFIVRILHDRMDSERHF